MKTLSAVLLAALLVARGFAAPAEPQHTFAIGDEAFLLDGKPFVIRCGEIHLARVPREYWEHRIKMAKAMGLNAVCVYLFWNYHEWEEGKFNWSGQADAAEFCRMAQREGLWVVLRPGPYCCAEWEMGGLPWWLLKNDHIQLRSADPLFMDPARRYLKEVGRVLGPLQITRGGPILMAQVENEYGSYGKDPEYMGAVRQALVDAGFEIPLFACNPQPDLKNGYRPDLFQVVNFGRGAAQKAFAALREIQKTGPLMNGEFYPGWFDAWGRAHHTGKVEDYLGDLEYMLKNGNSFSIYMAHGGTTWGLWSGADRPFIPDTSSYDYDAPISEAGWATEKFTRTREVVSQHLLPGEPPLPEPPAANPVIEVAPFELKETASILANLPKPVADEQPRTMEFYDQGRGCIVYSTTLPAGPAATLAPKEVHDFAWIFVDGKPAGVMDRRSRRYRVELPARQAPARLEILIEAVGRVNFGREIFDRKGLHGPVQLIAGQAAPVELKGWNVYSLPLDDAQLSSLRYEKRATSMPAFWRGSFKVAKPGDTFLDVRSWGKGVVWVNGHCLGRFWNIGPTQTMYVPGPWLREGNNDIVVLDLVGPRQPKLAGLAKPILDELHHELDFAKRVRAGGKFNAEGLTALASGSFTDDVQWQEARFASAASGRYLCIEAISSLDGGPTASIAELDVIKEPGEPVTKSTWKVFWVDSEEASGNGDAENALDGQTFSSWSTEYLHKKPGYPHRFIIDLGRSESLNGIRYLPRSGKLEGSGRIKEYRVYLSDKPFGLTSQ